jgi:hypothetical protein
MRRFFIGLAATLLAQTALSQSAVSPDDYAKLMQANSAAIVTVESTVKTGTFDDARTNVGVLRRNLMTMRRFWSERQRTESVRVIVEGMNQLTALEELLGRRGVAKDLPVEQSLAIVRDVKTLLASKELARP